MSERQFQRKLGGAGEVVTGLEELSQSVRIVLGTQFGSVAGRPDFGTKLSELQDLPENIQRPRAVREVLRALRVSEPRVQVSAVMATQTDAGKVRAQVTWRPVGALSGASRTTEVEL